MISFNFAMERSRPGCKTILEPNLSYVSAFPSLSHCFQEPSYLSTAAWNIVDSN